MMHPKTISPCAAVVLAAGASKRFGSSKQQFVVGKKTMLQHTVDEALLAGLYPVVVVTAGAGWPEGLLQHAAVSIVANPNAAEGMGTSISCGIAAVAAAPAAIVMVCDQPLLNAHLLNQLVQIQQEKQCDIVASSYLQMMGTPVLFCQAIFADLMKLKGDVGARSILKNYTGTLATVAFEGGALDIDTPVDLQQISTFK